MFLKDPGIYYEVHGKGDPLVLLNGIMMNTLSWEDHIRQLKDRYKLIIYDMRDQGQSDLLEEGYDIDIHTEDLKKLLLHLGIEKTDMLGLSYGGQVALIFALRYPEMLNRLVLANTTSHVDQYLLALGQMWKRAAALYDGEAFFDLALTPIYSRTFYNEHFDWLADRRKMFGEFLTKPWFDGFIRLASANATYDVRDQIANLSHPTFLVAAEQDIITPYTQMLDMSKQIADCRIVCIPDTGHAAFLEKIDTFCSLIKGFLT